MGEEWEIYELGRTNSARNGQYTFAVFFLSLVNLKTGTTKGTSPVVSSYEIDRIEKVSEQKDEGCVCGPAYKG